MNLSPHFTLEELIASGLASRRGIDNIPSETIKSNLKRIADKLEEVRALVGKPLIVSSGYRCLELNKAVGSSDTSAHVKGLAADFTCPGMTSQALASLIHDSDIEFDQLIYEGAWVHLGLRDGPLRHQVLTAHFKDGHVTYTNGIS